MHLFSTLLRLFQLHGTASRREFILVTLIFGALLIVAVRGERMIYPVGSLRFSVALGGLMLLPFASVLVRRLHDTGRSGGWAALVLLPGPGFVLLLVLALMPGHGRLAYPWPEQMAHGVLQAVLMVVALIALSQTLYSPYIVMTGSMKYTLLPGDVAVLSRLAARRPVAGDVIAFRHPGQAGDLVSRVVAGPGDKVQMKGGVLVVNGVAAEQRPDGVFEEPMEKQGPVSILPVCENGVVGLGALCAKSRYVETLAGGARYGILNVRDTTADRSAEITVPAGQYFVLGDNRDNARDSRFSPKMGGVGFVPADLIIGRVVRVLFSFAGTSPFQFRTWRSARYLEAVN
jgi:signal peptidase I